MSMQPGRPRQSVVAIMHKPERKRSKRCGQAPWPGDQPPDARQHRHDERRESPSGARRAPGVVKTVAVSFLLMPPGELLLRRPASPLQRADDRNSRPVRKAGSIPITRAPPRRHSHSRAGRNWIAIHPEPRMESPLQSREQQRDVEEDERRSDPIFRQHFYLSLLHSPLRLKAQL